MTYCAPGQREGEAVVIIGGGPAGLTAAYTLQKIRPDLHPVVIEERNLVGGIARTENHNGYRFDIGGHRFFTKVRQVDALWRELLPNDFLRRPRLSRIFYRGKYFAYPLKPFNALSNIGLYESCRIVISYAKWRFRPFPEETNFQQWVTNRFGARLFWHFFKTYTEKVWGIPCTEIQADWAAQRIKNLSLRSAVWNALTGANNTVSLIEAFDYPRLGPGMMWEACRDRIVAAGGEVRLSAAVTRIHRESDRIVAVEVSDSGPDRPAPTYHQAGAFFISSMPLPTLIDVMDPPAPAPIRAAAARLKHRDFLMVALIVNGRDPFPDNWIYVHSPKVEVGRIQNFRSWSEDLVPDPDRSSIGMEYFCQEGDALWARSDEELIAQASREIEFLGLVQVGDIVDGCVVRQTKAYPVYDEGYKEALTLIRGWLADFLNLQVVGRNGMHRYNNQDHSMVTAMMAAENIAGGNHDLWAVNVDQDYHEDIESSSDRHEHVGAE